MSQENDVPTEIVVAAFNDVDGAEHALRDLKDAKADGLIGIKNAAVLWKDNDGKVRFKETTDMRGGKGAAIGGVLGGVVGIVFPPSLLASAAIGAAVGGFSARLRDSGFPDDRLREVGEGLKPNTSALIAVIEHIWVREVEEQLRQYAASVVTEIVRADIADQLDAQAPVPVTADDTGESTGGSEAQSNTILMPPPDVSSAQGSTANPA